MRITEFSINRKITVLMFVLLIILLSFVIIPELPLEIYPDIKFKTLWITYYYLQGDPLEIISRVTIPAEQIILSTKGINSVNSETGDGKIEIEAKLDRDADLRLTKLRINENLKNLELPSYIYGPFIEEKKAYKYEEEVFVFYIKEGKEYIPSIEREILSVPGIKYVNIIRSEENVIKLIPKRSFLETHKVNINRILSQIRFYLKKHTLSLKNYPLDFQFKNFNLETINLKINDSVIAPLKEIFDIKKERKRVFYSFKVDGRDVVTFKIYPKKFASKIKISQGIRKILKKFEKKGVKYLITYDEGKEIKKEFKKVLISLLSGVILLFISLIIFERNLYVGILILGTGLASALITLIFFYLFKLSINILTIAGITLGLGLLVDSSIIFYDNVLNLINNHYSLKNAIRETGEEIFLPLLGSTITTGIVFLPFLYISKTYKILYTPFALAVVLSLFCSLFVTYFITPAFILFIKPKKAKFVIKENIIISKVFKKSKILIFISLLVLISLFYVFFKYVKKGTESKVYEERTINISLTLPQGTSFEKSEELFNTINNFLNSLNKKGYFHSYSYITKSNIFISLVFSRESIKKGIPLNIREKIEDFAVNISEAGILIFGFKEEPFTLIPTGEIMFLFKIKGYNYLKLIDISKKISKELSTLPYVKKVEPVYISSPFKRLLNIKIKSKKQIPSWLILEYAEIPIAKIGDTLIITGKGSIDFNELLKYIPDIKIDSERIHAKIERKGGYFVNTIGYIPSRDPDAIKYILNFLKNLKLPSGFEPVKSFEKGEGIKVFTEFNIVTFLSIFFVFIIIAIIFNSFTIPLLIFLSIPFSFCGVTIFYLFSKEVFDINALIGTILTFGIVVNDAILLVAHILYLYKKNIKDYILQGIREKIKPIIITSLTTIATAFPFLFYSRTEVWHKFALSLIGGLFFSTISVILFLPPWLSIILKKKE